MESTNDEFDESFSAANSLDNDTGTVPVSTVSKPSLSNTASIKSEGNPEPMDEPSSLEEEAGSKPDLKPSSRVAKNHLSNQVIRAFDEGIKTRGKPKVEYQEMVRYVCFLSHK